MSEKATRRPAETSLTNQRLYALLNSRTNFYLEVNGELRRATYDKELVEYNVVAFVTSDENRQASVGRITSMDGHKCHIRLLGRGAGVTRRCTYVLSYTTIKATLVEAEKLWRLDIVTSYKGSEHTREICVGSDVEKLAKIQLDLTRAAKGLRSNFKYTLKRVT